MRVAEINTFSTFSVGKIMNNIGSILTEDENNEVRIFYARGNKNISRVENIYVGNKFKIYINALIARFFDNDGFCLFSIANKLIKQLKKFDPDIIHIHCLHGYYMDIDKLFSYFKKTKAKIVWTMHDTRAITGHCCYFSMAGCDKWKSKCYRCPQKKEYPTSLFIDRSTYNFKKKKKIFTSLEVDKMFIVSPSNWLDNIIKDSYLSKYRTIVIKNGINTSKFNIKNKTNRGKVLLGVASVWDKRKGLNDFIFLSSVLHKTWKIILIGRIPNNIRIPEYIEYHERTTNVDALIDHYNKAAILFNSTLDDNYPTVNLEAQLCGCKVVCYDVGGNKETNIGNLYLINKDCNLLDTFNRIYEYPLNDIISNHAKQELMATLYKNSVYNLLMRKSNLNQRDMNSSKKKDKV